MWTHLLLTALCNSLNKQVLWKVSKATMNEKTTKKLSSTDELVVMEAIVKQPSIYLHEVQNK